MPNRKGDDASARENITHLGWLSKKPAPDSPGIAVIKPGYYESCLYLLRHDYQGINIPAKCIRNRIISLTFNWRIECCH